jgi:hypothetical protein
LGSSLTFGALLASLAIGVHRIAHRDRDSVAANTTAGAPSPSSPECLVRNETAMTTYSGACHLRLAALSVESKGGTVIRLEHGMLHLVRGSALFDVEHVHPGAPQVSIGVGAGTIEVVGTRFEVEQDDVEGSVHLLEGEIRFRRKDGGIVPVPVGERFRWRMQNAQGPGNAVAERPAVIASQTGTASEERSRAAAPGRAAPSPAARDARSRAGAPHPVVPAPDDGPSDGDAVDVGKSAADVSATVDEVIRLRGRGRYMDALAAIRKVPRAHLDAHTAEVLSFEEGNILEHLEDADGRCRYWSDHLRRFPQGTYRDFVESNKIGACRSLTGN